MNTNLVSSKNKILFERFDWFDLIKLFSNYLHFSENKLRASELEFFNNAPSIRAEYIKIELFQSFYNKGLTDLFNYKIIPAETKLRKNLIRIRKGECLNLEEINEIINIFEYFEKTYPELPHELLPIASELIKKTFQKLNKELKKEFRGFVSPHGEIEYNKHPILKELFQNIEDLEKAIRITITQMINSTELNESLQFNTYDSINDRFVLPIMSSRYKPSFGQIVSRSETGQTLYVEPFQIKNMVDKRLAAIMTLEDTIYKISLRFSKTLYEEDFLLDFWVNLIFEIDYYIGHIKFSQKYNLNKANISKTPVIKITNFFHPLIDNCVKNSLQLNDTHDGIIISGPNTGGKTIALKSTLICQLLFQKGLYVPSSYAELFPFEALFYHGADNQNILEGLSSFSAEVDNFYNTFSNLEKTNLIFSDEIFNSTSSEEASMLAFALTKQILRQYPQTKVLYSTHHELLKDLFLKEPNYLSAHVGFDIKKNIPTYILNIGSPGSSHAFSIFEKYFPSNQLTHILEEAKNILDQNKNDYKNLIQILAQRESELKAEKENIEIIKSDLDKKRKSLESLLELREIDLLKKHKFLEEQYIKKAEQAIKEIKSGHLKNQSKISAILKNESLADDDNRNRFGLIKPNELEVGQSYFCVTMGRNVVLKEIANKKALVLAGKIKASVELNSLYESQSRAKKIQPRVARSEFISEELNHDCRGMRLDDFINYMETTLANFQSSSIPYLQIIHGHGTGALKQWLRNYLKKSKDFYLEEDTSGNDGQSIIKKFN